MTELHGLVLPVLEAIKGNADFKRNWTPKTGWTLS